MKKLWLLSTLLIWGLLISVAFANYSMEEKQAYHYAHINGITTMNSIDKANMWWNLTRIAMAKMLSQYAINILSKEPANTIVPDFPDVDAKLNEDYNYGVSLAYQLGIMWIWIDKFRPYDEVTRAEFGTALSRMLYWLEDGNPYYSTHLTRLKKEWIIKNDNPTLKEKRWYVMLMLMRSYRNYSNNGTWRDFVESNDDYTYNTKIVQSWNWGNYRNEEYWFHLNLSDAWNDCLVAHQETVNKKTNKIEHEEFQLICPWEYAWDSKVNAYIPDGYARLVDIILVWPDTNERTLQYLSDQELIENNKYKFWFWISDASKDIFDWKVIPSDLECWKYPNCTCHTKENYQVWDFWDKVPNNYQEIGCFITTIVKDHIEIFDI